MNVYVIKDEEGYFIDPERVLTRTNEGWYYKAHTQPSVYYTQQLVGQIEVKKLQFISNLYSLNKKFSLVYIDYNLINIGDCIIKKINNSMILHA